jgi:hypothetical protein
VGKVPNKVGIKDIKRKVRVETRSIKQIRPKNILK